MSKPVPGRRRGRAACYAAAARGRPLRRRAARGRRRARPLHRRGRARADRRRVRAARRRARPGHGEVVSDRSFSYGDPDAAFAAADLVVARALRVPALDVPARSSATASSPTGTRQAACSPRGRTSRARSRCTPSRPRALGLPGLEAAADHAAQLRRQLRDQGDRLRLRRPDRPRLAQARHARALDGGPARAPRRRARRRPPRITDLEAAFAADGELLALRYDVLEDVGAYIRAPEPATLYRMHGSLTGAYRVRTSPRATASCSRTAARPGSTAASAARSSTSPLERTMAIAARPARARPGRARAPQPDRRGRVPLPHAVGRALRLGRLRGLPRRRARARSLRRAARRAARRARGRAAGRHRHRLRRRAVDLEHGLHHARADRPRSAPPACPSPATPRARRSRISPLGGITVRIGDDAAGPGARDGLRAGRRRRARRRPGGDRGADRDGHSTSAWTVSSRQLLVPVLGRRRGRGPPRRPQKLAPRSSRTRSARTSGDESLSLRRVARASRALEPRVAAARDGARPARDAPSTPLRTLPPPDDEDRVAPSATHGFIADVAVVEVDRATGRVERARLRHRPRRRPAAQPADRRRPGARRLRARRRRRAVRAGRLRRRTATCSRARSWTTSARRRPTCRRCRSAHRETPSPFTPLGAKGIGEGNTMSVPAAIANAVADALGIEHVELPLTPGRVWELLAMKPVRVPVRAAGVGRGGGRAARRARRRGEGARRRPEPRADAEHAARPPVRPRRRQPRCRSATSRENGALARRRDRPPGAIGELLEIPLLAEACRTSATSSRATAAPSAGRSRTRTPPPSCRSR